MAQLMTTELLAGKFSMVFHQAALPLSHRPLFQRKLLTKFPPRILGSKVASTVLGGGTLSTLINSTGFLMTILHFLPIHGLFLFLGFVPISLLKLKEFLFHMPFPF